LKTIVMLNICPLSLTEVQKNSIYYHFFLTSLSFSLILYE